jgi:hypothetical protein
MLEEKDFRLQFIKIMASSFHLREVKLKTPEEIEQEIFERYADAIEDESGSNKDNKSKPDPKKEDDNNDG